MTTTGTVRGTYGSGKRQCDVFTYEECGGTWYAVDGSTNVNFTHDDLSEGVNVEELRDSDTFTASEPIRSEEDLEAAVEDQGAIPDDDEEEEPGMDEEDVRDAFWIAYPDLNQAARIKFGPNHRSQVRQNQHDATTRSAFVDFVDNLCRDGSISDNTANGVTL